MQESQPYIMTRKRSVRRIYWGRIVAVVVALSLAVIGGVLWFSRTSGELKLAGREYWFVSMGEYTELAEASSRAAQVVESGGAGYVYGNENYKVAASCYASRSDAVAVSVRLADGGENVSVFSLSSPDIRVQRPKENAEELKKLLLKPAVIFDELYDVSVKTDKAEINESATMYAAVKMSASCREYASAARDYEGEVGEFLSSVFDSVATILDNAVASSDKIPQRLRYALCDVAVSICSRSSDFAKLSINLS